MFLLLCPTSRPKVSGESLSEVESFSENFTFLFPVLCEIPDFRLALTVGFIAPPASTTLYSYFFTDIFKAGLEFNTLSSFELFVVQSFLSLFQTPKSILPRF